MWYLPFWYFLDKQFKYAPYLYNGCHGLIQKAMNFNDIGYRIVIDYRTDYRIHFLVYEQGWCNKYIWKNLI